jgi:hypothetical protein
MKLTTAGNLKWSERMSHREVWTRGSCSEGYGLKYRPVDRMS